MLLLPSFTSTIYEDEFLLIVAADKPPSFLDKVVRPFVDTLTPGAWAMVGAVVACTEPPQLPHSRAGAQCVPIVRTDMSFAMMLIEGGAVSNGNTKILKLLDPEAATDEKEEEKLSLVAKCKQSVKDFGSSVYYGFLGATSGAP